VECYCWDSPRAKVKFGLTSGPQSFQVAVSIKSITLKWPEAQTAEDGVHVVLAHFWPGEQRGSVPKYIFVLLLVPSDTAMPLCPYPFLLAVFATLPA